VRYPVLIFDLDDTLLDTWRQLVQPAAREACAAMVETGLDTDLETCVTVRRALFVEDPRGDCYRGLVSRFGVRDGADPEAVRAAGHDAYFRREVEPHIRLFDGAGQLLARLGLERELFLVTSGHPGTQARKVEILGIADFFRRISYVDSGAGERKGDRFREIMRETAAPPEHHLVIGDRLDREIRDANQLGMHTCHVRYGEFSHIEPREPEEEPRYAVNHIRELANYLV